LGGIVVTPFGDIDVDRFYDDIDASATTR